MPMLDGNSSAMGDRVKVKVPSYSFQKEWSWQQTSLWEAEYGDEKRKGSMWL